jgi:hypothetical protein
MLCLKSFALFTKLKGSSAELKSRRVLATGATGVFLTGQHIAFGATFEDPEIQREHLLLNTCLAHATSSFA